MSSPKKPLVYIFYGPYDSFGIVEHRISHLSGLTALLQKNGFLVLLMPYDKRDEVEIVINGETIFQCKIQHLLYDGDGKMDPLCAFALKTVQDISEINFK